MKRLLISTVTVLFITGAALAQDKTKAKAAVKKDAAANKEQACSTKSCCKQPSKTAGLRAAAAKKAKPAKPDAKK